MTADGEGSRRKRRRSWLWGYEDEQELSPEQRAERRRSRVRDVWDWIIDLIPW